MERYLSKFEPADPASPNSEIGCKVANLASLIVLALKDEATTAAIDDKTVQQLFTLSVRLFVQKAELEERIFAPFSQEDMLTATEVVTIVPEMLRAADLSAFDLALWLNRPRKN